MEENNNKGLKPSVDNTNIPFIRFNHLWEKKKIVTNIFWESIVLNNQEFYDYLKNNLEKTSEVYKDLDKKYFIKTDKKNMRKML